MNNKEILKNVLVTVGLLTISIVALLYFNSKLNESTSHRAIVISPSATIHPYTPTLSSRAVAATSRTSDVATNVTAVAPNTPTSVNVADYPNNLVVHASSNLNTPVVSGGGNSGASGSSRSSMVQQRQQMQMGALTAVSSRRVTSDNGASHSTMSAPFQDATAPPGTISRKDFPVDPEEPFPDEDEPIGSGLLVLGLCALGYTLKKKLAKVN